MSERNLFDSFNSQDNCLGNIIIENSIIDLTDDNHNSSVLSDNIYIKDELQSIDIFSDYEFDGLRQFGDDISNLEFDNDENDFNNIQLVNVEMVNETDFKCQKNIEIDSSKELYTSRKLETKLPCLLIDQMDINKEQENFNDVENENRPPPHQIEIEPELPDLKKSDIITKQDLLRYLITKSKSIEKDVCNSRLNNKRKQIFEIIPDKLECNSKNIKKDINNQSECEINKFSQVGKIIDKTDGIKRFFLKISSEISKEYYLLSDLSRMTGLGIIEFICKYVNKIDFIEISFTEFRAFCRNSENLTEINYGNNFENGIISFVEINDNLINLLNNIRNNKIDSNNTDENNRISSKIKTKNSSSSYKCFTNESLQLENDFIYTYSPKNEFSRRKQILLPRKNYLENSKSPVSLYRDSLMQTLRILFDLQSLSELSIRKINESGAQILLEQLKQPFPIFDQFISSNFIPFQTIIYQIKECTGKLSNQANLLINLLRLLVDGNRNISEILNNFNLITKKMFNIDKDINNWLNSNTRTNATNPNSNDSSVRREALRITIHSYQLLDLIKEFSQTTHQLLISYNLS